MPVWIKNAVMIVVSGVWAVGVVSTFLHGQIPSAVVWAVPGATYALLSGNLGGARRVRVDVDAGPPDEAKP